MKANQACNWEKGHLDRQSCPFVFKREKQSMSSIKQICERSKWFQSLLPVPEILAFNDWMRPRDRDKAAEPANEMEEILHNFHAVIPVLYETTLICMKLRLYTGKKKKKQTLISQF